MDCSLFVGRNGTCVVSADRETGVVWYLRGQDDWASPSVYVKMLLREIGLWVSGPEKSCPFVSGHHTISWGQMEQKHREGQIHALIGHPFSLASGPTTPGSVIIGSGTPASVLLGFGGLHPCSENSIIGFPGSQAFEMELSYALSHFGFLTFQITYHRTSQLL